MEMLLHHWQVLQVPSITSLVESDQERTITTLKQDLVPGQAMLSITTPGDMSIISSIRISLNNLLKFFSFRFLFLSFQSRVEAVVGVECRELSRRPRLHGVAGAEQVPPHEQVVNLCNQSGAVQGCWTTLVTKDQPSVPTYW